MPAKVYHSNDLSVAYTGIEVKFPTDYKLVAEVDTDDLETAFFLTNTVEVPWHENDGVTLIGGPTRSTSPGDVVEINGKFYRCEMTGWKEIQPVKE